VQFEELLHVWPLQQVLKDLIRVFHSLAVVLRPGFGDHSGGEGAKFPQIITRKALKNTGL
jgi:hypothetical protein